MARPARPLATVVPLAARREPPDDRALALGLAAGDAGARAACYDRYAPYVERLVFRTLGPDDDLADALQETFEIAFRDARRLEDPARLRGWLGSIAVFVARGMLRKRRRRWLRFFAPADLPEQVAATDPSLGPDLARAQRALDRLPDEERIALVLRRLERLELTEVAAVMGVSLATAKRRIARAQARFEEAFARDAAPGDEPGGAR